MKRIRRPAWWALAALLVLVSTAAAAPPFSPTMQWLLEAVQAREAGTPAGGMFRGAVLPARGPLTRGLAAGASAAPVVRLLVTTDDPSAIRGAGFDLGTAAGGIATVFAPVDRLDALAALPGVRRVAPSFPLHPLLDVSVPEVRGVLAHGATQPPYPAVGGTGRGVVIGIVDTGIDLTHPDFRNTDGSTRVIAVWDQTDSGGPAPSGYNYGSVWIGAQVTPTGTRERDLFGHGTHVSGIAAGNGLSGTGADQYKFIGMAPDAQIVFVKTDFQDASVIDAVNWIEQIAGERPSVVNLSLGGQFGPHDGTSDVDRALSGLTGPGRLIVAAAGNEGGSGIHADATIPAAGSVQFKFFVTSYTPSSGADQVFAEGWYPASANLSFKVTSPSGVVVPATGFNKQNESASADGDITVTNTVENGSPDRVGYVYVYDKSAFSPPKGGTWTVEVANSGGAAAHLDFWLSYVVLGDGAGSASWTTQMTDSRLVGTPASSDSVIAVGAYVTKTTWLSEDGHTYQYTDPSTLIGKIASFSSPGPRRDGLLKPEISAPGMGIASARSSTAASADFNATSRTTPDGYHLVSQGTSQACPHVAGALALLLEKHPKDAAKEARARLTNSARRDAFTGPSPNPSYGYGKLDAFGLLSASTPVELLGLAVDWEDGAAVLRWILAAEETGATYTVERAAAREGPYHAVSGALTGGSEFAWTDPGPAEAESWYRVRAEDRSARTEYFGPVKLDPLAVRVSLWQNAPNPFQGNTKLAFSLESAGEVALRVFDVSGRQVTTLASGRMEGGRHEATWDGTDAQGRPVAAGVYFYRLATPGTILMRRMVLTR